MSALLIDFESTGLNTSEDRIIEIGALLVDDNWNIQGELSVLVKEPDSPPITEHISKLTGITQAELDVMGVPLEEAFRRLATLVPKDINWAIAYNREFDENIFRAELARSGCAMLSTLNLLAQASWLCAMLDLESNYNMKCWKLSHLALDYGIPVDPRTLHRALDDVKLMRELLMKTGQSPMSLYTFQRVPWVYVRALIPKPWEDGGKGRDEAKRLGYNWETCKGTQGPKFDGAWVKRVKQTKLDEELQVATIKVREIRGV